MRSTQSSQSFSSCSFLNHLLCSDVCWLSTIVVNVAYSVRICKRHLIRQYHRDVPKIASHAAHSIQSLLEFFQRRASQALDWNYFAHGLNALTFQISSKNVKVELAVNHNDSWHFPRLFIFRLLGTVKLTNLVAWLKRLKVDKLVLEVVVVNTTQLVFVFNFVVNCDWVFLSLDPE